MKKWSCLLLTLLLAAALCVPAAAAQFGSAAELFAHWESEGYPDDIGGVYSTDGTMDHLTILLVDGGEARQQELRALLADPDSVAFGTARYSHNELMAVNDEIVQTYMVNGDGSVNGCGVGWTSVDGEVVGFGPSGREDRVTVSVSEARAEEYIDLFQRLYGSRVIVEVGSAAVDTAALEESLGTGAAAQKAGVPAYLIVLVLLALIVAAMVFSRRRVPAAQTAGGGQAGSAPAPYTRGRTRAAVRASTPTPPESLKQRLMERLGQ